LIHRFSTRFGVLGLAIALVLVPAVARARQHVERREATRLSIRHSWIGVAPPSKASVSPQPVVVVPAIVAQPEPCPASRCAVFSVEPALHHILEPSPDPLRGPPSARIS
jgi:hypothetical protein